ncbi:MAG: MATE family efflux transporter, partial [Clostridia bacterium]|nr:MATE family efflux transporter [Clostridia bacterium]
MIRFFSSDAQVMEIGLTAFRIMAFSFITIVMSLTYPVLFQAVGQSLKSSLLTVIRTVVLFVPLGYLFSRFGLDYFWLTYIVTDGIVGFLGFIMAQQFFKKHKTP